MTDIYRQNSVRFTSLLMLSHFLLAAFEWCTISKTFILYYLNIPFIHFVSKISFTLKFLCFLKRNLLNL